MSVIVDDTAVIAALDTVESLEKRLFAKMGDLTEKLNNEVSAYPPPPAGSTYVRTYRLQNSWQKTITAGSDRLTGVVRSAGVDYNIYVKDPRSQAEIHRGRHKTTQDIVDDNEDYALELFGDEIQLLINRSA